jgi:pimeloyl-ACP methyl ester carboxylesterase
MTVERRSITLTAASGRRILVDLTYPETCPPNLPPIVFSHGANAAPDRYRLLLDAWAEGGFAVAAPLHVDSEDHPDRAEYDAAAIRSTRIEDYAAVDAMLLAAPELARAVIAAGHSYGALIAQLAGGARLADGLPILSARRPVAVIALSPPPPMPQVIDADGWSSLAAPMLTVTGTRDIMPGFVDRWEQHLAGYHAQRCQDANALVFGGMDHYFGGAFGRLKPDAPMEQVDALNRAVLSFARHCLDDGVPPAGQWLAGSTPGADTMTRLA